MLSDDKFSIEDPLEACSKIEMPVLGDDIFRLLILENSTQPEKLVLFVWTITDSTLKKLLRLLRRTIWNRRLSARRQKNEVSHAAPAVLPEAWLTRCLCIRATLEAPAIGAVEAVLTLVGQASFTDQLHICALTLTILLSAF